MNGSFFVLRQPSDYNHWRLLINTGWARKDVLLTFKRLENWQVASRSGDALTGSSGLIAVSANAIRRDIFDYWIEATLNAIYQCNLDYNGNTRRCWLFPICRR